jgi:hypothetical protein
MIDVLEAQSKGDRLWLILALSRPRKSEIFKEQKVDHRLGSGRSLIVLLRSG